MLSTRLIFFPFLFVRSFVDLTVLLFNQSLFDTNAWCGTSLLIFLPCFSKTQNISLPVNKLLTISKSNFLSQYYSIVLNKLFFFLLYIIALLLFFYLYLFLDTENNVIELLFWCLWMLLLALRNHFTGSSFLLLVPPRSKSFYKMIIEIYLH